MESFGGSSQQGDNSARSSQRCGPLRARFSKVYGQSWCCVGARVCDPQQLRPPPSFAIIPTLAPLPTCCGSQSRAPIVTLCRAFAIQSGALNSEWSVAVCGYLFRACRRTTGSIHFVATTSSPTVSSTAVLDIRQSVSKKWPTKRLQSLLLGQGPFGDLGRAPVGLSCTFDSPDSRPACREWKSSLWQRLPERQG